MLIKLTRSRDTFTDRDTGEERKYDDPAVYVNPAFIKRVSRHYMGDTVVEVHGVRYDTWCKETPDEIYAACQTAAIVGKDGGDNEPTV